MNQNSQEAKPAAQGKIWHNADNMAEAQQWRADLLAKGATLVELKSGVDRPIVSVIITLDRSRANEILGYEVEESEWLDEIDPAHDLPFMTTVAGHVQIHAADTGSVLPDDWSGICVDGSNINNYWYIGRDSAERSFTLLQASNYDAAVREVDSRTKGGPKLYADKDGTCVEEVSRANGIVSFCALGGGFVRCMPENSFNQVFNETQLPSVLYPFRFSGEWLEAEYNGYTDGRRWNGWAIPLVTKEVLCELIAVMEPANSCLGNEGYKFRWDGDVFYVYDPQDECEFAIHATATATVDGHRELYDISLGWCWDFLGVAPAIEQQAEEPKGAA